MATKFGAKTLDICVDNEGIILSYLTCPERLKKALMLEAKRMKSLG